MRVIGGYFYLMNEDALIKNTQNATLDEIYKALGVPTDVWYRKGIDVLLHVPISRFWEITHQIDQQILKDGFTEASQSALPYFLESVNFYGENTVPKKGPLLIIANHVGAMDTFCIAAGVGRDDLRIIVYDTPLYHLYPGFSSRFIYATDDEHNRMSALREGTRHLQNGGALLLYGTGLIDPDPAFMPGVVEAIDRWSSSISLFLRQTRQGNYLICITSGLVSPKFAKIPIIYLKKDEVDRRRLIEFSQFIYQLVFRKTLHLCPNISFSNPTPINPFLSMNPKADYRSLIVNEAKNLLFTIHMDNHSKKDEKL